MLVVPPASSVPATTVLPCRHRGRRNEATVTELPTVHVHVACHIQRARQRRRPELRLLTVVAPAFSVPATTVLPVLPATVNLFDEIASDPSDAVTANFPLFTSTSPATFSVLDSVAAPELRLLNVVPPASSVPATTVLPVLRPP